jgi:hypothetical protein
VKKHLLLLGFALATAQALYAQNEIGEVFSSDASVRGSVVLSGNGAHVLSGSQVSAGDGVAVLKLARGGELRICPKTNLSLSVDPGGTALVLGMNAGAMELNYSLQSAADSLLTPDFRVQLISPGNFHLAISVAASGDTCMRSLPGNDASIFVAEMMGNGAYQLSPGKNVLFKAGRISGATDAPSSCGCPELKVEAPARIQSPEQTDQASTSEASTTSHEALSAAPSAAPSSDGAEPHLEVESSFVYRGNEAVQDYYESVARLSLSSDNSGLALRLLPKVSGPVAQTKPPEKNPGILHRFGNFLGRLFRK